MALRITLSMEILDIFNNEFNPIMRFIYQEQAHYKEFLVSDLEILCLK